MFQQHPKAGVEPDARVPTGPAQNALLGFTVLAVIAGTVARFKGLGSYPLGWDEYYLAQSVQFVLHSGLPQYPCGGFYTRGLLVQYLAAALQLTGLSAELAPRVIAAVSSLIALPAAYRLARRCGGVNVGLLTVCILSLSVWEVEIGRFGRMYAPFQAAFLWYVVFFLQYTLERRVRALVPMLLLSLAGVFIWEGGALLALANFLAPFCAHSAEAQRPDGKLTRQDLYYLIGAVSVFLPVYWFATADLRVMGTEPTLPAGYQSIDDATVSALDMAQAPWHFLRAHLIWMAAALLPLGLSALAARWVLQLGSRPLAALGLLAALALAVLGQFLLCAVVVLLLLLLRLVEFNELMVQGRLWLIGAGAWVLFWTAFGLSTHEWRPADASFGHSIVLLAFQFVHFPDVVRQVIAPWAHSLPTLGAALLVLLGSATVRALGNARQSAAERVMLVMVVALVVAASAADTPRHETRYVFFLYPLALAIALSELARLTAFALRNHTQAIPTTVAVAALLGFALTEDFRPVHLTRIDTPDVSFRQKMDPREAAQYPARADLSGAADWLRQHVSSAHDLVVNGFPGVDFYYPQARFFFMESTDERFEGWSCHAGTLERWSNLPLLYSIEQLKSAAATHERTWLVIESGRRNSVLARLRQADPSLQTRVEWIGRNPDVQIVALSHTKDPA